MGDLKSWLIFVAGALAALAFGIMCLVAVTTALIRLVSGRGQTRTKIRRVASAKEHHRRRHFVVRSIGGHALDWRSAPGIDRRTGNWIGG